MDIKAILKAQGYTDADLAQMDTLLSDQRFAKTFDSVQETARSARDAEWEQIKQTEWESRLVTAEKQTREARLEAARLLEENKIAREWGYMDDPKAKEQLEAQERDRQQREERERGGNRGGFDPNDPKFADFAKRFSTAEGDAIALYQYLGEEYRALMGVPLNDYRGADGSRGMIAIRREAMAAGKPVDQYMESRFDWAGKRAAAEAKRIAEHDAEVGKQAVEKWIMENPGVGNPNPMLQGPQLSRNPFIPRAGANENGEVKQPWERGTAMERASARRANARATQLKSMVQ
jgi:hypothetical protein